MIKIMMKDLNNCTQLKKFTINQTALKIIYETEKMCFIKNVNPMYEDYFIQIIRNVPKFNEILEKYGGDSKEVDNVLCNKFYLEIDNRQEYTTIDDLYSLEGSERSRIIFECMEIADKENRREINEVDLIFAIMNIFDEISPVYNNGTWTDERLHTPYNTLAHLFCMYREDLCLKFETIRWEFNSFSNKEYDLAISFAGEDRSIAKVFAYLLSNQGYKVFYDEFEKANLWGKDLYSLLSEVYGGKAKFCLMIISKHYAVKHWTNHERKAAQYRAFIENQEYILPLKLDDTTIPGLLPTIGYIDFRNTNINDVVDLLKSKLSSVHFA